MSFMSGIYYFHRTFHFLGEYFQLFFTVSYLFPTSPPPFYLIQILFLSITHSFTLLLFHSSIPRLIKCFIFHSSFYSLFLSPFLSSIPLSSIPSLFLTLSFIHSFTLPFSLFLPSLQCIKAFLWWITPQRLVYYFLLRIVRRCFVPFMRLGLVIIIKKTVIGKLMCVCVCWGGGRCVYVYLSVFICACECVCVCINVCVFV